MNISHIDMYIILILGVLMGSLPAHWQIVCLSFFAFLTVTIVASS